MTTMTTFDESGQQLFFTDSAETMIKKLAHAGIILERWETATPITPGMSNEAILEAYNADIERLKNSGGYQSVDVISLNANSPNHAALRQKFLEEHTHSEDEVRFFVDGHGMFYLHIDKCVFAILCGKGDLISIPAGTTHWFDMGPSPQFTAIRLFTNPEGWVAQLTGSSIASQIPYFE